MMTVRQVEELSPEAKPLRKGPWRLLFWVTICLALLVPGCESCAYYCYFHVVVKDQNGKGIDGAIVTADCVSRDGDSEDDGTETRPDGTAEFSVRMPMACSDEFWANASLEWVLDRCTFSARADGFQSLSLAMTNEELGANEKQNSTPDKPFVLLEFTLSK